LYDTNIASPRNYIDYTSLDNAKSYKAYSYAYNAQGGKSDEATKEFTTPNCPGVFKVINVDTICTSDNKVTASFSWEPSSGATEYFVDLSTVDPPNTWDGLNSTFINNAGDPNRNPVATNYTWIGLDPGKPHYWRVYASNGEFGRHAYASEPFKKNCAGGPVSNDKAILRQQMINYILAKKPSHDFVRKVSVNEAEKNIFAAKLYYTMGGESFSQPYPSTAVNSAGAHGILQYLRGTWTRQHTGADGSTNIWYKPGVDSGKPNSPPDQRDGVDDGNIFSPYAQIERTVWSWDGAETGNYQSTEWNVYTMYYGGASPFECNIDFLCSITQ
jgi:hypothetical protein